MWISSATSTTRSIWQIVEQALTDRPELLAAPFRAVIEYLLPIPPDTTVGVRKQESADGLTLWILTDPTTVAATASVRRLDAHTD